MLNKIKIETFQTSLTLWTLDKLKILVQLKEHNRIKTCYRIKYEKQEPFQNILLKQLMYFHFKCGTILESTVTYWDQ